jgi:hypothetical protein
MAASLTSTAFAKVGDASYDVYGATPVAIFDVTLDAAYPSGGYGLDPSLIGLRGIAGIQWIGGNSVAWGLLFNWDTTNNKFVVSYPTGGATNPGTTLSNPVATASSTGVGTIPAGGVTVQSTAANGAIVTVSIPAGPLTAGQGKQVTTGTNLTTVTVRVLFFGLR